MAEDRGKRSFNFSEEEKIALLQFVQQHKAKLLGKAGRPGHGDDKVEERKAKYWERCAVAVNSVGGKERDWKKVWKVRKQWFALKDRAKKLKAEMGQTGGGPKPHISKRMHLCMEVMARESLEGIRGRETEVDPTGNASPEMSQNSSQETFDEAAGTTSTAPSTTAPTQTASPDPLLIALKQQVHQLQTHVETLSTQPSVLQRASEIRQLKFQEELLKLEKSKLDLQRETLEVQKDMLKVLQSFESRQLLRSMTEQ